MGLFRVGSRELNPRFNVSAVRRWPTVLGFGGRVYA